MLTSPRAVREISRCSIFAGQGRLTALPNVPPERSLEPLTLRHIRRPWTSFRLGRVFSSLGACLRRKSEIKHRAPHSAEPVTKLLNRRANGLRRLVPQGAGRAALIAIAVIASGGVPRRVWAQDATWLMSPPGESFNDVGNWTPAEVPTRTASFGESSQLAPLIEANTALNQIEFTLSAQEYTIGVGFVGPAILTFSGLNGLSVINSSSMYKVLT